MTIGWVLKNKDGTYLREEAEPECRPQYFITKELVGAKVFYYKPRAKEVAREYSHTYQPEYPKLIKVNVITMITEVHDMPGNEERRAFRDELAALYYKQGMSCEEADAKAAEDEFKTRPKKL